MSIRVRFAPSPTGYLHVGGARTALFNWLLARKSGGTFILRIEDTDEARNTEAAMNAIFEGLSWLGIDWDEGPQKGGDYGPYFQSQRQGIYDAHFKKLEEAGRVYFEDNGAARFKFSREAITIPDMVCGDIRFAPTEEPDMTVRRPDGSYIFHFCNVVDDIEMGMTHVIRGEDHISNTWKHIDLFNAFGAKAPIYGHIPLLLNPGGSKMSKRDEGASIDSYLQAGFLPQAVFNYLCLLGWTPKLEGETFSAQQAVELFDISDVHHSNARFDMTKCTWVNQQHLRLLDDAALVAYARPWLEKAGITPGSDEAYIARTLNSVKEKVSLASEFPSWVHFFFTEDFAFEDEVMTKLKANAQAPKLLAALQSGLRATSEWSEAGLSEALTQVAATEGVKPGALMPLLRFSLSGQTRGPDVKVMMVVLGQERSIARLGRAAALLA
ncbi:glutamate--tRNA ligase [Verrucomicrobium spinosum]|uniref:glutamate--tRNA ligase n=1 Tax=Verrucomicrobium spinosum TaxID=2736 RepID=UPI00017463D1|nr:glutamate--tRNA ligase family protein [Verrucomicrobium spinosum]